MGEAIKICYKCTRFRRDYNTGSISCRCHGFYPDKPHTMPKKCRNYKFDERKVCEMTPLTKGENND